MNREIKFRAWDKAKNEWINPKNCGGYCFIDLDGNFTYIAETALGIDKPYQAELKDLIIIEQFTGLHDKNGKEIWEGDIVWYSEYCIGDKRISGGKDKVYFENGCFLGGDGELCSEEIYNKSIKVIGNIHENPELLKEQK